MKAREKRRKRARRLAPRRAFMKAWHDSVDVALQEAKAAGVRWAELRDAMWRNRFEAAGLGPLMEPNP